VTDEERAAELAPIETVGCELARLGLTSQVARLRRHYAAVRAGRVPPKDWTPALTLEWARMLRLPPHERHYRVLPRMSPCPDCPTSKAFMAAIFPGGARFQCSGCGAEWLELDAPQNAG
jgi:hypothetical protein